MKNLSVCLALLGPLLVFPGEAHEQFNGKRNQMGEWCCGVGDCFEMPKSIISMDGKGYWLFKLEHVPFAEVQPSMDGGFWRCKRPDGSRRCFFAPPPAM